MKVLVDTSVWSMALRRPKDAAGLKSHARVTAALSDLINDARTAMIGPVRQELLSGIREPAQYARLRNALSAFPDVSLTHSDYETAAEYYNECRRHGVQGSNTDFLICAIAVGRGWPIYSLDRDFVHFKKYLPIELWAP